MHGNYKDMFIPRALENSIHKSLQRFAVTAILGPRQCGKSTLARHIMAGKNNTVYLDLERPSDLNKLDDAEWFFSSNRGSFFCIDEIQRKPELFPLIRSLADKWGGKGHFLVLGSASRELLRQSSETLAGRISYHRLTPFTWPEIAGYYSLEDYLVKGGFPGSLMTGSMEESIEWRDNFIGTFIERDLLQWAGISPAGMRRLWQMLANANGQLVNYSALANSLGVSNTTVKNYIDLLQATYMLDIVQPLHANVGKRITKSPKIYVSDHGLVNAFAGILSFNQLSGHILLGSVWESLVLQNLKAHLPRVACWFYQTSHGAEVDFVLEYGSKRLAVECKASLAPTLTKGNFISMDDVGSEKVLVVTPTEKGWEKSQNILVASITEAIDYAKGYFFENP